MAVLLSCHVHNLHVVHVQLSPVTMSLTLHPVRLSAGGALFRATLQLLVKTL